jgi:hypothetical protein
LVEKLTENKTSEAEGMRTPSMGRRNINAPKAIFATESHSNACNVIVTALELNRFLLSESSGRNLLRLFNCDIASHSLVYWKIPESLHGVCLYRPSLSTDLVHDFDVVECIAIKSREFKVIFLEL